MTERVPTTEWLRSVLAGAGEVEIVELGGDEPDRPDAARTVVSGDGIAELGTLLAIVDGGVGDRCRCPGWPTIIVRDAAGAELDRWTLHHQTRIRAVGASDADLRDGPALTDWLAGRGLTGPREVQRMMARAATEREQRRARWVAAAPAGLQDAAESVSRRADGAEQRLAALAAERYPDPVERIRTLVAWAGFPTRNGTDGTPSYELEPGRIVLAEPAEAIFDALASDGLTAAQLDGAAEVFTSMEWTLSPHPDLPDDLRSRLVTHVTATGTDPMRFRMRHGYGRAAG